MALPVEILDYILSFLQSDPAALKKCSESHPSLCRLAEPYLYSHILLETDNESDQCSKPTYLTQLLSKRPYIARYIRSLEIRVCGDDAETQQRCLEEISTILPNLLALRGITLDHAWSLFDWDVQPESFRLAFLDCLHSQSIQDLCINYVYEFPIASALNGESKSIRNLTVLGGCMDGPFVNQVLPLKSLCIEVGFIQGFAPWFATCRSQLHSLEFLPCDDCDYALLPLLLASSSNSLTSLDIHLGLAKSRMSSAIYYCTFIPFADFYDFNSSSIDHGVTAKIPVTLSTLPRLEQLTIRATLHYIFESSSARQHGFYSPIPAITLLFSSNASSLKHLILDFDFTITSHSLVRTDTLSWSFISEVFCSPLVHLLSTLSASECSGFASSAVSIQVDLHLSGASFGHFSTTNRAGLRHVPIYIIHYILSGSKELMQFVEQGRLIVTPPVPTSFNIYALDCW